LGYSAWLRTEEGHEEFEVGFAYIAGDRSPHRMQRLLGEAVWDADAVRDDVRRYVVDELGDPGYEGNSFQCPSETTSTVPSVTLMAVWSSIAYAGPAISAAHLSAAAMVLSGM
jgi:hypothetical protein